MKRIYLLIIMAISIFSCSLFARKPKGELTYCSYRCSGAAGLGTDYCQLIAESDSIPKVVVVLNDENRFGEPVVQRTYSVDKSVVDSLQQILMDYKVYKLNGYHVSEPICGGHSHNFEIHYSSGDAVSAYWYGHKIKEKAWTAYHLIEHFFAPWRAQAVEDEKTQTVQE